MAFFAPFLGFLAKVPAQVWGIICTVVLLLVIFWAILAGAKASGKKEAETKAAVVIAEIETRVATDRAKRNEVVIESIAEDARVIEEIENEIAKLTDSDIAARARRWVRKQADDSHGVREDQ